MGKNSIDASAAGIAMNSLQAIPFGQVIGGPLKACIDAQSEAALSTFNFINNVGIERDENGNNAKAIYVNFTYQSNGVRKILTVPILTLVPIPYIAIKSINIAFKANISASSSVSTTTSESLSTEFGMKSKAKFGFGIASASVEMNASISSKKDSTATRDSKYSVEYTMDVGVTAGQEDMPAGMLKVLEILNNSLEVVNEKGELFVSANEIKTGDNVYVSYKGADGLYNTEKGKITISPAVNAKNIIQQGNGWVYTFEKEGVYTLRVGDDLVETINVE